MIKPAVLDAMVAAGCTAEQIAAAVKADQAKASGAERQARYRARKASQVTQSDATSVTLRNAPAPKEIPPTPPKENTPPHEKEAPSGASKKRGERLPDDFRPDMTEAAEAGLTPAAAEREWLKFRDYFRGAPGQKGVKQDWPATWRNWCRKAVDDRPRPARHATGPPAETVGSLSKRQIMENNNAPHTSNGRLDTLNGGRLEEGPGDLRTAALTSNIFGRI